MKGFDTFAKVEPIEKGWSEDKKYCVTKTDGTKYLLRITPASRYETRKALFEMLERVAALGIPICGPVEFGTCADGVYSLQRWIDGEDLEAVLPLLPETEQYVLGLKSGEILREMHTIPAPETQEEWASRFSRKTNGKIQKYRECGLRFDGDDYVIEYIEKNRELLENRPQCFQHGDYHVGNMMIERGELIIIDFDRYDFGDPWEEFNRIVWSAAASPHFATGQLRGYFGGEPPIDFFKLLAFYISSNTLSSIYWAVPFGRSDLDTMMRQAQDVLRWFDNMRNPIPAWYLKEIYPPFDLSNPAQTPDAGKCVVRIYDLGTLRAYRFAVIFARYQGKWLYCRAKERDTFETAGGHIEPGETPLEGAKRELYEETGAVKYDIAPAFDYTVHVQAGYSNGQVFIAHIQELGDMPNFEMTEIRLFDTIPDKMRFPKILPILFEKVRDFHEGLCEGRCPERRENLMREDRQEQHRTRARGMKI